jgi:hypothetical protein
LSTNSRGQVSSLPAGVTSWPSVADVAKVCGRATAEQAIINSVSKLNQ